MDTRAWVDALIAGARKGGKDNVSIDIRWGVVVSAAGHVATIRMSGGTATLAGVRAGDSTTLNAGQLCLVLERGTQRFILDTVTP